MARCFKLTFAAIACVLTLAGCLSAGNVEQRQQFLIAPKFDVTKATPTTHTLGIRPIDAARPYALSMLYTDGDGALLARQTATWAEPPATSVTRALQDAIVQTGRFADAGDAAEMARPEYVLTGELRKFHEDRTAAPASAIVEVRLELRQALGAKLLWADTLTATAPLTGEKPADIANALSSAVAQLASKAATAIANTPLP